MRIQASCVVLTALLAGAAPSQSADQLFARLTDREKAGQLFMSWTLSRATPEQRADLAAKIADAGLGGVIFSLGSAEQAADLIAEVQSKAAVPLLCAGDFEAGVGFRLSDTTDFGNNMLIGATGLARLSRAVGRATGDEARALGFHWCFAPVVDVNINPANPIINVRSFGEDPEFVARMSAAFVRGVEAAGVIATAKHFPGHGDVASDSHLTMPTVPGSRERLEQVELPPFRAAIDAGLSSIMTGHLSVPGLGEDPAVPATLSHLILTELLRESWEFDGLIVTDALDMGGVREEISPVEASVRALAAGADMLLMPPDPVAARDAIVEAVASKRVPRARFEEAVHRVLRAKQRMGLLDGTRTGPDPSWQRKVATEEHAALAAEVARRGVTLVRDDRGLVPIAPAAGERVFVVLLDKADPADTRGELLGAGLANLGFETRRIHPESDETEIAAAAAAVRDAETAVGAFAIKVRSYSGEIGIPDAFAPVVEALRAQPRTIAVSLGNPYLIHDFSEVGTYLCAFAATEHTERAISAVLEGESACTGRMPVRIPGISAAGAGLTVMPPGDPERALPSQEGLPDDLSIRIRALCEEAIADGAFPGASVCVTRRGCVVAEVAVGRETYDLDSKIVTPQTRYDLASLTKVCATTPTVLRLVAAGELSLDQRVSELVPSFSGGDKGHVTIRHLLTHSAGLPAYVKFFLEIEGKDRIVEAAATTALESPPGTKYRYSDLGLILLMACVEEVTGEVFDAVARREVFAPLGMDAATFVPSGSPIDAPPTEDDEFRGRVVRGEVHDENAWAMGGVSGHAGLFATALDVARLGNAFLGAGRGWLPAPLAREAIARASVVEGSTRALGWDTAHEGASCGSELSLRAFGHTGFTGTSVWCDPATDLCIVLLTNRVHPTRANKKVFEIRKRLADLVARAIID